VPVLVVCCCLACWLRYTIFPNCHMCIASTNVARPLDVNRKKRRTWTCTNQTWTIDDFFNLFWSCSQQTESWGCWKGLNVKQLKVNHGR
jgi:hypothetical protein